MANKLTKQNIPKGWQVKQIKDLLEYERPEKYIVETERYVQSGTPVLTANKSFILGYTDETSGIYTNVPVIIFDDFTTDCKFVDFPFKVKSSAIKILKAKDGVDLRFVYEMMKSIDFPTGAHKRYYISQYQDLEVLVPPLAEQKKIAEILSAADEEIKKTDEIIAATEKLKHGLLQELFTRGTGHSKFKKTEIGEIPEGWNIVSLGDVARFIDYRGKTPQKAASGIPLITAKNVRYGYISEHPREYISEADYVNWMTRGIPKKGDVLFTTEAPLGNVAQIETDQKIALAQRIITIQSEIIHSTYLKYMLLSPFLQKKIHALGTGGTVKGIKASTFKKLPVLQPSRDEQEKIAEILSAVDEKIVVNQKLKEKQIVLKKGLMHDLLSGKVRVRV